MENESLADPKSTPSPISRRSFLAKMASRLWSSSSVEPPATPAPGRQTNWGYIYPCRVGSTYRTVSNGGIEIYDHSQLTHFPRCHSLNTVASMIWNLCLGQYSVLEISQIIAQTFQADPDICLQDTVRFLDDMHRLGALTFANSQAVATSILDVELKSDSALPAFGEKKDQ